MNRFVPILLMVFPAATLAGENAYNCKVSQILEMSDAGLMQDHTGVLKSLIGSKFSINRDTGAMAGLPFTTASFKQVTVLDRGSSENSFKAIVTSHPPNMWVKYIYVAEHATGTTKPFWGTDDGNMIFSGQCD